MSKLTDLYSPHNELKWSTQRVFSFAKAGPLIHQGKELIQSRNLMRIAVDNLQCEPNFRPSVISVRTERKGTIPEAGTRTKVTRNSNDMSEGTAANS